MKGVGIDLCQIARIEKALAQSPAFLSRYYTPQEQGYLRGRGQMAGQSAAAMFAAKEAFLKAMGKGIGQGIALDEISVCHGPDGAPYYQLTGAAKTLMEQRGVREAFLSLSHEDGMAAAVCVLD